MRIDWEAIQKEFESGTSTLSALADRYCCHRDTIRRKAKKEGWKRGENPRQQNDEKIPVHRSERHRSFWKGVEKRLARGLKTKDVKQGLEELKVAKMAGEVISSMIRSKRMEMGLEEDSPEKGTDDAQDTLEEMARVTASSGAEEALD